jgi:hypothetical protein
MRKVICRPCGCKIYGTCSVSPSDKRGRGSANFLRRTQIRFFRRQFRNVSGLFIRAVDCQLKFLICAGRNGASLEALGVARAIADPSMGVSTRNLDGTGRSCTKSPAPSGVPERNGEIKIRAVIIPAVERIAWPPHPHGDMFSTRSCVRDDTQILIEVLCRTLSPFGADRCDVPRRTVLFSDADWQMVRFARSRQSR